MLMKFLNFNIVQDTLLTNFSSAVPPDAQYLSGQQAGDVGSKDLSLAFHR